LLYRAFSAEHFPSAWHMPCVASYLLPKLSNAVIPPAELDVYLKAN
jgi:hypothetical protein